MARNGFLVIALLIAGALAPAAAEAKRPKAPTATVVEDLLIESFGHGSSIGETFTLTFERVKFGKPRKARPAVDLVRAGVTLYPARARFTITSHQVSDGMLAGVQVVEATILVYRDERDDWTYVGRDVKITVT